MDRDPAIYIMASGFNGTIYTGVTSNLLQRPAHFMVSPPSMA